MGTQAHSHSSAKIQHQLLTAEHLCSQRGSRLTPLRKRVLETLLRHHGSLKAYELLDALRTSTPGVAPPTVYRALDFLTEQGLIHRLDAINAWTACTDAGGTRHDLLIVCIRCGTVAELSDPDLSQRLADCVAQTGFALDGHETELRAICARCLANPSPSTEAGLP
ncbi:MULTISPECIES: Fur family transcriptional regulator [unclassified Castellaniella]|jgi:Fur family zinc uptake transcriptional regulator|uniref:Fur family transcriptional regulator n=1 Tax=unclassified Castellaniella TaxID=2617606 RepID=UPI0033152828